MNAKTSLLLLANEYAMNFVACTWSNPNNEEYSKSRFIQEIKSKYGVRSFIRVWYWSRVYKGFVKYYNVNLYDILKSLKEPKLSPEHESDLIQSYCENDVQAVEEISNQYERLESSNEDYTR